MFELLDDSFFGVILIMLLLTGIAARYWSQPVSASSQRRLTAHKEHTAKLHAAFEDLSRGLYGFEGKMRKQFEMLEGKLTSMSEDVDKTRRETHDIDKHVGRIEVKSAATTTKLDALKHQADLDAGELKRIGNQNQSTIGLVNQNAQLTDHITYDVHHIEHEAQNMKLRRMDEKVKSGIGKVDSNARQIGHIEQEVKGLLKHELSDLKRELHGMLRNEVHGLEHPDHYRNGDYENRRKAITELESANRKIENLMDETIQVEAGYQTHYSWDWNGGLNGTPPAQEYEEHHRKLIDTAQHIYRDVRRHLNRAAVQDMEAASQKIDWNRGELFANPASPEVARAYHQAVKEYFVALKSAIASSMH